MWFVYILECADKSLYTGITNNVEKRLKAHNDGKGAKYTKTRRPVEVMVTFERPDRSSASKEEYRIKQLTRAEKIRLIEHGRIKKD